MHSLASRVNPSLPAGAYETALRCVDLARACILPHFRTRVAVDDKQDDSPVTIADKKAETSVRDALSRVFPEHNILGEEWGNQRHTSRWTWVIDPIDGTRAFITGRPTFTTLLALLDVDRPVLGIIDQPVTRERWIGIEGGPTQYESAHLNGQIGTNAHISCLKEAELSCTSPEILVPPYDRKFATLSAAARRTSWGGDAYAYGLLTLGQIDLIAESTMKPWDWAALVPIIQGAGGKMTDWQGNALTLESDGTVLASANGILHKLAIDQLNRV